MLDASGIRDENEVLGNRRPDLGCYHMVVTHMDSNYDKYNAVIATLQVLHGKTKDGSPVNQQVGRELTHMMFLDDNGQYTDKHLRFAVATRLIEPGTKRESVDWQEAVGRQCVATIEQGTAKGTGNPFSQIANYGLAIWHPLNPEVKDIPKDQEALKLLGNSGNATNPPPSDPQPGGSDWSKI